MSNGGSGDVAFAQYEFPFCMYADGIAYELSSIRYDGGIAGSAHFVGVYVDSCIDVIVAVGGSVVGVVGVFVVVVVSG